MGLHRKVNSRNFFAVLEEDLRAPVRKRSRKSRAHMDADPLDFEETLDELKTEVARMHEKLDKVFSLTRDSPVPAGLRILLQDSLKCKICHITPLQPPIIFAKCCKSILGYERYVDEWYADGGLSKNCPGCRGPRGLAETVRLHGLDDLVKGLQSILGEVQ